MDLILSKTIYAEQKTTNCQTHGIYFVSCNIPHLLGISQDICKMMCLVFVLMTASLAMQKNTNCQSAQGRYLNTLWVSNSRSSRAHSFLKMISTSTFKQMDNHYANQVLLGNSLLYWWSVRGNCSVSHTPDVKGHTAPPQKKKGWGDKVQGAGEK